MRGYGQGHFLVLLNGMKINEVFNAGVGNFLGQLDTSLIESVEIGGPPRPLSTVQIPQQEVLGESVEGS